jgi:hypothetical protein
MKLGNLSGIVRRFGGELGTVRVVALVLVALSGTLVACSGMPEVGGLASDAPMEVRRAAVEMRAKARWEALIAGDYQKAYGFMTAASRQATSLDGFRARGRVAVYRSATVDSVTCEVDACSAEVFVNYDHRKFKGGATRLKETWVLERGQMSYVDPIK